MKFGKRLKAEVERSSTRYSNHFIDYSALKLALKGDVQAQDVQGTSFEQTLYQELHKVAAFYTDIEEELEARMQHVLEHPSEEGITAVKVQLTALHKYAVLNYIAVVKAVKKRNRHLSPLGNIRPMKASVVLQQQYFYTSLKLASLKTRANIIANETALPASPVSQIAEDYTCPVCLTILRSPVVLSCAHLICWACLLAHCSAVKARQQASEDDNDKITATEADQQQDIVPVISVSNHARWVNEDSELEEEESSTLASFACPCCRKDQLMDLDKLQADPYLDAFLLKLEQSMVEASAVDQEGEGLEIIEMKSPSTLERSLPIPTPAAPRFADVSIEAMDVDAEEQPAALAVVAENDVVMKEVILTDDVVPAHRRTEPPLLPPQSTSCKDKITVCLDLDGTLVTTFTPKRAPILPPDASAYTVGKGGKLNPGGIFVVERPGLGEFLHRCAAIAEVVIFTAGLEDYAAPILDALEHRYGPFEHRLYRPATTPAEVYPCVKDLSRLGRDLSRCVLVDDTPLAFFNQPDNGVPVLQFRGDVDDRLLTEAVAPMIEALSLQQDVRVPLASRFNMRSWFASQGLVAPPATRTTPVAGAARLHRVPSAPLVAAVNTSSRAFAQGHKRPYPQAIPPRASVQGGAAAVPSSPIMLVCDFDKTLMEYDAGERVCDELAPELTSLLAQMESPANFVPATNSVLSEMQRRGVTRDRLVSTLNTMGQEMPAASVQMLQWAVAKGIDVSILSDCNTMFISHMLNGAKVAACVKQVVTNAAAFVRAPDGRSRLVITPRHDHKALGSHGCALCPSNLCKGRELATLRTQTTTRIVYAGDSANDLCPALNLRAGDVVLARAGYPLDQLLTTGKHRTAATVHVWESHEELFSLVQSCTSDIL